MSDRITEVKERLIQWLDEHQPRTQRPCLKCRELAEELISAARAEGWEEAMERAAKSAGESFSAILYNDQRLVGWHEIADCQEDAMAAIRALAKEPPKCDPMTSPRADFKAFCLALLEEKKDRLEELRPHSPLRANRGCFLNRWNAQLRYSNLETSQLSQLMKMTPVKGPMASYDELKKFFEGL